MRAAKKRMVRLGICPVRPYMSADLRRDRSASDRETPLITGVNGTLMARRGDCRPARIRHMQVTGRNHPRRALEDNRGQADPERRTRSVRALEAARQQVADNARVNDQRCATCGRPLDAHDRHVRFRLPQPVLDSPDRDQAPGTWLSHGTADESVMMQVPSVGPFVRALLPVRQTCV